MRTPIAVLAPALILAAAQPALAQLPPKSDIELERARDAHTVGQMQAAKQHDTALKNDLSTLRASEQTRQVLSDISATGARPAVPTVPFNPKAPPPRLAASQFAEIPSATLAASNARAVAASENKR